jgi:hypothetical protein
MKTLIMMVMVMVVTVFGGVSTVCTSPNALVNEDYVIVSAEQIRYHIDFKQALLTYSLSDGVVKTLHTASFAISTFDDQEQSTDPSANNVAYETAADSIIDFTEGNPFSEGNI